jgi:HEAT repeat protein
VPATDDAYAAVPEAALGALVSIGHDAVFALMKTLDRADPWHRAGAAEALGLISSREAVPALIRAVDDDDVGVCVAVAEALGRIGGHRAQAALVQLERAERDRIAAGGPADVANAAVDALVLTGYYEGSSRSRRRTSVTRATAWNPSTTATMNMYAPLLSPHPTRC